MSCPVLTRCPHTPVLSHTWLDTYTHTQHIRVCQHPTALGLTPFVSCVKSETMRLGLCLHSGDGSATPPGKHRPGRRPCPDHYNLGPTSLPPEPAAGPGHRGCPWPRPRSPSPPGPHTLRSSDPLNRPRTAPGVTDTRYSALRL